MIRNAIFKIAFAKGSKKDKKIEEK